MDAPRLRLASLEAEFLRSLSAGGPYPPGSDLRGMHATSQLLWAKRLRTMARAWPELAQFLGNSLRERATQVLAGTPLPPGDHALQDGLIVTLHLAAAGPIPDGMKLRMLGVKLRYRWQRGRLVRRACPAMGLTYLRQSGRLNCALRVPGFQLLSVSIRAFSLPRSRGRVGWGPR